MYTHTDTRTYSYIHLCFFQPVYAYCKHSKELRRNQFCSDFILQSVRNIFIGKISFDDIIGLSGDIAC